MGDYHYWLVLLPAKLTWVLQPLNVQAVVLVKCFLRERVILPRTGENGGSIVLLVLRDCVAAITTYFSGRDWGYAAAALGLNGAYRPDSRLLHV